MDHTLQPLVAKLSQLLDRLLPLLQRLDRGDSPAALMAGLYGTSATACAVVWAFYGAGVVCALALALSGRLVRLATAAKAAIGGMFALFSAATLLALMRFTQVHNAAAEVLRSELQAMGRVQAEAIGTQPLWLVVALHLGITACVAALLWSQATSHASKRLADSQ